METHMMISIIVPIYNSEPYLDRCLASLEKQTYTNIEILMIDDGSTDGSAAICRTYEQRDPRFRYIHQENCGVSAARNHGLRMARGAYIGFCDSDDWAEADMYECLHTLITENGADVAIVSAMSDHKERGEDQAHEVMLLDAETAIKEMHRGELFQGHLWNKLIRAELIGHSFREDVAIYEDMLFMWQALHRAARIAFCDLPKYHYTVNTSSALRASFKDSYRTVQLACAEMLAYMETCYPHNLIYAKKTAVLGNYTLADKLARAGMLTRGEYRALREIFRSHYTAGVGALFDRHFRIHMKVFLRGRIAYLCYLKAKDVYRRLRSHRG